MALVKCDECGQQVSTSARACPHCGAPPKAGTRQRAALLAAVVAGAVGVVVSATQTSGEGTWLTTAVILPLIIVAALAGLLVARLRR